MIQLFDTANQCSAFNC